MYLTSVFILKTPGIVRFVCRIPNFKNKLQQIAKLYVQNQIDLKLKCLKIYIKNCLKNITFALLVDYVKYKKSSIQTKKYTNII